MYGMKVHEAVKNSGEKKSGITIHFVNEEFDKGEIIFQAEVLLSDADTSETIAQKVQQLEHEHLAKEIEKIISR